MRGFGLERRAVERVQVLLVPSSGGWKPAKVREPVALGVRKSVLMQDELVVWA